MSNYKEGKFIVIEGMDGTGKTSLAAYLTKELEKILGITVINTREPGGTYFGDKIRDLVLISSEGDISPLSQVLLFSAARETHIRKVILPLIRGGVWVICDRFIDSTMAYQCAQDPSLNSIILELEDEIVGKNKCYPDFTVYLDVENIEVALNRAKNRSNKSDLFESKDLEYFTKVRDLFRYNFEWDFSREEMPSCFTVINAELPQEEVSELALKSILNAFKENKA